MVGWHVRQSRTYCILLLVVDLFVLLYIDIAQLRSYFFSLFFSFDFLCLVQRHNSAQRDKPPSVIFVVFYSCVTFLLLLLLY